MPTRVAALDVVVVVVYIVGTTLLGVWFTRRQRDIQTYFVGDRNVSWWLVLVSIVATETSTVTFLSVPGLAFKGDMTFLQLPLGYLVGRILISWLLLPLYLRGDLFTAYQVLRQRFSPAVQQTASALFLVTRTVGDGLRLFLTGLLLAEFTGWNIYFSIIVMTGVTLVYTYLGGMQAVIWTDLIQFILYVLGAIVAAIILIGQLPDGLTTFMTVGSEAGKFRVFDWSPTFYDEFTFWAGLIGGTFISMASHGADQIMVQRYLCSRSLREARLALVSSGVVVLLQFVLFLLIGVGLYAHFMERPLDLRIPTGPTTYRDAGNDEVFGLFITGGALPHGIVGLVIAAVLAAAMSTLSSSLNSSAGAFVNDFYRQLRPGMSEARQLLLSKMMTLCFGLGQMAVALLTVSMISAQPETSIIRQVLTVAGFTTGMVLGLFLLGRMRRTVSSTAALTGLVAGFLAVLAVWLPAQFRQIFGDKHLAWPWYAPLGTTVTVVVALAVHQLKYYRHGSPADGSTQPSVE